jgi:hypothetical protein
VRRIGVLLNLAENDPEGKARLGAFLQGLQQLGWTIGRNVQIEYRWGAGDPDRTRGYAAELAAARAGRHPGRWRLGRGVVAAGDPHRADRVHADP